MTTIVFEFVAALRSLAIQHGFLETAAHLDIVLEAEHKRHLHH